jgi:copper chaperone CopZ
MSDTVSKEFVVYGMSCMGCVRGVTGAVSKVAGVSAVDVSLDRSCATVEYDPSAVDPAAIVKAIEGAGFEASPR